MNRMKYIFLTSAIFMLGWICAHAEEDQKKSVVPPDRWISDDEARRVLMQCESALGHAENARAQYLELKNATNLPWRVRLEAADTAMSWGDFCGAEQICREYLAKNPGDRTVMMRLAKILTASQQFEEAEGIYRRLLADPSKDDVLSVELAAVKKEMRHFKESIAIIDGIPADSRERIHALLLKGEILLYLKKYGEAQKVYEQITGSEEGKVAGKIGIGRAMLGLDKKENALKIFDDILGQAPDSVDAAFYRACCAGDVSVRNLISVMKSDISAISLDRLGKLCMENGYRNEAVRFFEAAVDKGNNNAVILMDLAQAYSIDHQFDRALPLYEELSIKFPESYKILLERARALSWARRYEDSINLYARIAAMNTSNAVPVREMARVAVWAKEMERAERFYSRLLSPEAGTGEIVRSRIQKAVRLESEEKKLAWDKRFLRAEEACDELVEFDPGNLEGWYDLTQIELALGMRQRAENTAQKLLELDPSHTMAPLLIEKLSAVDHTYLDGRCSYWHEKGRGYLSDISRCKYDAGAGVPVNGQGYIEAKVLAYEEQLAHPRDSYRADGASLEGGAVFLPWLKAEAGVSYKDYSDGSIDDQWTGFAEAGVNLKDYLRIDIRRERKEELYNRYGLLQGVYADSWVLSGSSFVNRDLEVRASGRNTDYSDDNRGECGNIDLSYAFTDHPRIFKMTFSGELRDTDEASSDVYSGSNLVDIIHPYWTPQNYGAGSLTLEWYHDVSRIYSMGTDLKFYDLALTIKDDTDDNRSVEFRGQLHWEFRNSWLVYLEGVMVMSDEWDAQGLFMSIRKHLD